MSMDARGTHNVLLFNFGCCQAKGKGVMKTHWVLPVSHSRSSNSSSMDGSNGCRQAVDEKELRVSLHKQPQHVSARLVNWMADLLLGNIKKIVSTIFLGVPEEADAIGTSQCCVSHANSNHDRRSISDASVAFGRILTPLSSIIYLEGRPAWMK